MEELEQFFRKRGRRIFLASDLPVISPDEPAFAPDLIAVLDVTKEPDEELPAWVVAAERLRKGRAWNRRARRYSQSELPSSLIVGFTRVLYPFRTKRLYA
jgi:hypothetical protein